MKQVFDTKNCVAYDLSSCNIKTACVKALLSNNTCRVSLTRFFKLYYTKVLFITFYTFSDMPLSCPFNSIQYYNNIVFTMKEIPASYFSSFFIIITIIIIIISYDGNMDKAINVKFWSKF